MTKDDKELYSQLQELFDIAWDLNKTTRTELSQKVTTYLPGIMQEFLYLCDAVESRTEMRKIAWEEGYNQGYITALEEEE